MAKVYSIALAEFFSVETIDMDTRGIFQGKTGLSDVRSLQVVLSSSCQKYAQLTAFSCEGGRLSYRDLGDLSDQFAAWLLCESTLVPGDRVAIHIPNLLQYPLAALGIIKAGMVLVSGFKVYPAEIEGHVLRHPDIREAAVIGVTEKENEYVKLFVISDNPDLAEEDIFHFCRQGLTSYKVPRKIEFRATLPRSNVGKILKRQLREEQPC